MKHFALLSLSLLTLGNTASAFAAQGPAPAGSTRLSAQEQGFTELLTWHYVNGKAKQLAISPGGAVLALGLEGEVWQWQARHQWGLLPGRFAQLAIDKDNTPWAVDYQQHVFRYNGSFWQEFPGTADTITAGADGSLWILTNNLPAYWIAKDKHWQPLQSAPSLQQLAIHPNGHPWAITKKSGNIVHYNGKQWLTLPEVSAQSLSISPDGDVLITDKKQQLLRWNAKKERWDSLNKNAASVAAGPRGKPWIITSDSQIQVSAYFDELPTSRVKTQSEASLNAALKNNQLGLGSSAYGIAVVGKPGTGTSAPQGRPNAPLEYRKINSKVRDIAIGADGSVFTIMPDGSLARWSNTRNTFIAFPGQFTQIAISPDGKPWGISNGDVFRFDGTIWRQIPQARAQSIAIGYDGTVIISDPQSFLQRYDPAQDAFVRLPPDADGIPLIGSRVAVTPTGKPWVIGNDGFISNCERKTCERLLVKALSLSIGPEGSIIIIDSNRQLKRWNTHTKIFEPIESVSDIISQVAVGPHGKPWLLNTGSELWASAFFPRDESHDTTLAGATDPLLNTCTQPTPPTFRFTVSRVFEKISTFPLPFELPDEFGTQQIAINPTSGQAVLIDTNLNFFNFKDSSRALVRDNRATPAFLDGDVIRSFIIDNEGNYWITSYFENNVWRFQQNSWKEIPHDWSAAGFGSSQIMLARAPDNTIYATGADNQLYRYDTVQQRFVQVTLPLPNGSINDIAVSADGHFWATSENGTAGLYEYTNNQWVLRLANTGNWLNECSTEMRTCIATGAEGSVYTLDTSSASNYQLQRWNPIAKIWESFNNSPNLSIRASFAIGNDGRPWAIQRSHSGSGEGLYRAR